MKTCLLANSDSGLCFRSSIVPSAVLALSTFVAGADTTFINTSYVYDVPAPGILVTNALGQAHLKGNVHVLAVQGSDPRVTGAMQAAMDLAYQPDGTALFCGNAYFQVGTWQNQTNFSPAGELWVMSYRGVAQADNSDQITMTGYGIGGNIDGLRMEATGNRGPGPVFDPTIPYLASGVIKAPPVTRTNTISFTGLSSWTTEPPGCLSVQGNQLTMRALWSFATTNIGDTAAWTVPWKAWSVMPGQTLEARVKLVRLSETSSSATLALYHDWGLGYLFFKGRDFVSLAKQSAGGAVCFELEKVATSNTNVVLVLALTPSEKNVILTGRVLDGNRGEVLCQLTAQDTPAVDPSLSLEQYQEATGTSLQGIAADSAGPPWTSGTSPCLMVDQYTDGTLPAAEATFEAFEMRAYDLPPVGISRAVQVTVPCAQGMSYFLESAPTLNGPWLPVDSLTIPGVQSFAVPASKSMEFFRPQLAP